MFRPFHRLTTSPHIRLIAVTHLLDFVCALRCIQHNRRASVDQVMDGRISYAACCNDLLDQIERALEYMPLSRSQTTQQSQKALL